MLIYLSSSHCSLNVPDCHWCRAGEGGRAGGRGGGEWLWWQEDPGLLRSSGGRVIFTIRL